MKNFSKVNSSNTDIHISKYIQSILQDLKN